MPLIIRHGSRALVVLDKDNLERVTRRDPLFVNIAEIQRKSGVALTDVVFVFGDAEDHDKIAQLGMAGRGDEAVAWACRGYSDQPGDRTPMVRLNGEKGPQS